jgi:hypothetical protein
VVAHGGTIEAHSEGAGSGTTVTVGLPAIASLPPHARSSSGPSLLTERG